MYNETTSPVDEPLASGEFVTIYVHLDGSKEFEKSLSKNSSVLRIREFSTLCLANEYQERLSFPFVFFASLLMDYRELIGRYLASAMRAANIAMKVATRLAAGEVFDRAFDERFYCTFKVRPAIAEEVLREIRMLPGVEAAHVIDVKDQDLQAGMVPFRSLNGNREVADTIEIFAAQAAERNPETVVCVTPAEALTRAYGRIGKLQAQP